MEDEQMVLTRAEQRMQIAQEIMSELGLIELWSRAGRPVPVGAVAYGVPVATDIDMETYCPQPTREAAMEVLNQLIRNPRVKKVTCTDLLADEDNGIYTSAVYLHESGEFWKMDMWLVPDDHKGPTAAMHVEPLQRLLRGERRTAVLRIKEAIQHSDEQVPSYHVYRAVVEGGVRTPDEFWAWYDARRPMAFDWLPE